MRLAKDETCNRCKEQAVVFVGGNDPDLPQFPMCRKHADEWKLELMIEFSKRNECK